VEIRMLSPDLLRGFAVDLKPSPFLHQVLDGLEQPVL